MKLGILTFNNIPNIGAILQAQALCQYIRLLGYDCDVIDYTCDNIVKRELTFHPRQNILDNLLAKYIWRKNKRKILACNEYIKGLGEVSRIKYDRNTIIGANSVYDVFISGSDMIWNLDVNGGDLSYFLDFTDDCKVRISFASSIGAAWSKNDLRMVLPLLKRYHSISVREYDTKLELNKVGIDSHHLMDPTILIDPMEWLCYTRLPKYDKFVLVYFPTKELIRKAKEYANRMSLRVIVISQGLPTMGITKVSPKDPPEWLGLIAKASAVFTNSFHGLLFSLYYQKQVWTANYGNRIISLLNSLSLQQCRLDLDPELKHIIDFTESNIKIDEMRKVSQNYIRQTLENIRL